MNARATTADDRCASLQKISNITFAQSLILPYFQEDCYISIGINKNGNPRNLFDPCPIFSTCKTIARRSIDRHQSYFLVFPLAGLVLPGLGAPEYARTRDFIEQARLVAAAPVKQAGPIFCCRK
jgi:hypothetical protein